MIAEDLLAHGLKHTPWVLIFQYIKRPLGLIEHPLHVTFSILKVDLGIFNIIKKHRIRLEILEGHAKSSFFFFWVGDGYKPAFLGRVVHLPSP
jgi:hypothetical protein